MKTGSETPAFNQTLNIVNKLYWNEQVNVHNKDKDIIDIIQFTEDWGLAMEQEMKTKNVSLTRDLAERLKPALPMPWGMTYQLMQRKAKEILYATWAYGEELAAAYDQDMDKIRDLRKYAADENASYRAEQPSSEEIEEGEKRLYLERKKELTQKYIQKDEALLASLDNEKIEFKDEESLEKFFEDYPQLRRTVTLFLKLCQKTMRDNKRDTLSRSIISSAKNPIHSHFQENTATQHAIIRSWKYGEEYAECLGYSPQQIRKILPPVSGVRIHYDHYRH